MTSGDLSFESVGTIGVGASSWGGVPGLGYGRIATGVDVHSSRDPYLVATTRGAETDGRITLKGTRGWFGRRSARNGRVARFLRDLHTPLPS